MTTEQETISTTDEQETCTVETDTDVTTVESPAETAEQEALAEVTTEESAIVVTETTIVADATAIPAAAPRKSAKQPSKKLIIGIAAGIVAVALIVFCAVFFTVIQPNNYYQSALAALETKDFTECQRLLDKIPNHKGAPQLRQDLTIAQARAYAENGSLDQAELLLLPIITNPDAKAVQDDITYMRAKDALTHGKLDDAKDYLDKIQNHDDPDLLRSEIKYQEALVSLDSGDYTSAHAAFSDLGDYKDSAAHKEAAYYEALAFRSLFVIQKDLKNPSSMRLTDVVFYKDSSKDNELDFYAEITASNSYGGNVTGYAYDLTIYEGEPSGSMISHSAYVDPDDYYDVLLAALIDSIKKQTPLDVTIDIARMNRLLKDDVSFKIDIDFESGATVVN